MTTQEEADKLRAEAKVRLTQMFGIQEGYSSGAVERIVDCIIGAAILESAAIIEAASKKPEEG
jgi:hypothetical protein